MNIVRRLRANHKHHQSTSLSAVVVDDRGVIVVVVSWQRLLRRRRPTSDTFNWQRPMSAVSDIFYSTQLSVFSSGSLCKLFSFTEVTRREWYVSFDEKKKINLSEKCSCRDSDMWSLLLLLLMMMKKMWMDGDCDFRFHSWLIVQDRKNYKTKVRNCDLVLGCWW